MMWTTDMYRRLAVFLWGAVSLVVGLSVGFYFNMSDKKILFIVVVAMGLYVLALLRWFGKEDNNEYIAESNNHDKSYMQSDEQAGFEDKNTGKSFIAVGENESKLADDESREWLDDFLVKQQKNR